jgi:serine/threonine protein kinase
MQRYKIERELGDGAFGTVSLAFHLSSGDKVAIKRMKKKYATWEECVSLREVKSLKKLVHPNIVRLREVIRDQLDQRLYFVFEYCEDNLLNLIRTRQSTLVEPKGFTETEGKWLNYQLFLGLAYMHKHGYFHRDMKPENVLVTSSDVPLCIKIGDFGLARELRSRPPFTEYISTRWYRAPEILLRATTYSSPIDLWAAGCIMAEILTLKPVFPGSTEMDQIFRIANVLGSPTAPGIWREGARLAGSIGLKIPAAMNPIPLNSVLPSLSSDALALVGSLIAYDPSKRPSAVQSLTHLYFTSSPEFAGITYDSDFCITAGHIQLDGKCTFIRIRLGINLKMLLYSYINISETKKEKCKTPVSC